MKGRSELIKIVLLVYIYKFEKALIFDTPVKLLERQNWSWWSESSESHKLVSISLFHSAWSFLSFGFFHPAHNCKPWSLMAENGPKFWSQRFWSLNFDPRNKRKLIQGRLDRWDPCFRPTSRPDRQSHTNPHPRHNNLRIIRVNDVETIVLITSIYVVYSSYIYGV